MEDTLFKYIKRYSWKQQLLITFLTVAYFPFLYASLELPKTIVNQAIAARDFPRTVYGYSFEHVPYLMILCGLFLLIVAANGGFKYYINVYKGQLGERMLRRLRYQLFSHVLRFPVPHFRRTSQGEVIAMITSEVEPIGGFIGDALAQPMFMGGTLLTTLGFMFAQDIVLGLAAVSLYPLQIYLIPKLQKQVNALAKQRVRTVRRLSERIGEAVSAIEEVHTNDTSEHHRAEFAYWSGIIYGIRYKIYRKKFFVKFLNNFIAQLTPFFFYSIGGYLVIRGQLTFGALVAVLSAYKDLSSPWKELLDWYQQKEDARVKYEQLVEQFRPADMLDPQLQEPAAADRLSGPVVVTNVSLQDETGVRIVESATFRFELGERVALLGGTGSGIDVMAKLLARLLVPTSGTICFGGDNAAQLPEAVCGQRLGYVGQHVALLNASIRDNLYYPLRNREIAAIAPKDEAEEIDQRTSRLEAEVSGNTLSDLAGEWIDYGRIGLSGPEELKARAIDLLGFVELEPDLFALGLKRAIDPTEHPNLAACILEARVVLRERLTQPMYAGLVEIFDKAHYNRNMTVAENLLFGLPVGATFDLDRLGDHPYVQQVLDEVGLRGTFLEIGLHAARVMVDLFKGLPPGHEFFERFSFISSEQLADYESAVRKATAFREDLDPADRGLLESLPFRLVAARHRLGLIDQTVEGRILEGRRAFAQGLPAELHTAVAFFDPDAYNPAASVQDNILFGKLVYGRPQAQAEISQLIADVVGALGLRAEIVDLGLDYEVGIGGSRLSVAQRQKLGIARVLIKQPDLIILDQATSALDGPTQQVLFDRLMMKERSGSGLVWTTGDVGCANRFDRVIRMEGGRVIRSGPVDAVAEPAAQPAAASG